MSSIKIRKSYLISEYTTPFGLRGHQHIWAQNRYESNREEKKFAPLVEKGPTFLTPHPDTLQKAIKSAKCAVYANREICSAEFRRVS